MDSQARQLSPLYRLLARNRRGISFLLHALLFIVAFGGSFLLRFDFNLEYAGQRDVPRQLTEDISEIEQAADKVAGTAERVEGADRSQLKASAREIRELTADMATRVGRPGRSWLLYFFLPALPILLPIKLAAFGFFRLYDGWWRYAGFKDLLSVMKAAYVATLLFFILIYGQGLLFSLLGLDPLVSSGFPRSIYLLDLGLTIALVGGVRLLVRLWHEEMRPVASGGVSRLLIIGAGEAGNSILREIHRMPVERYRVVGFIDDDPNKHHLRISGIPVLGPVESLDEICEQEKVDEILIAIPSATRRQLQRIVNECEGANVKFRTVPAIADLIDGKVSVSQIKEVDINDLLGRDPVTLDREGIARFLNGRSVLITGAGGSIGAEMCRQVAAFSPSRLVLVEQAENNLFFIERELRDAHPGLPVVACICDITDRARTQWVFERERPGVVFHAAAHKHVPLMETNPGEAIKNNVFGTRSVADAAAETGVEKFVMISTDKAVNPTSVMGCSKRVAEIYIQNLGRHCRTQFVTVRFGNVLGSAGSVVPIFRAQIAAGGPVTITDERMVRYFMTIPEASQLVLQAGAIGNGGEVFVLDMGEPVKIVDLARTMITLSGFRPDEDIEIRVIGRRPGEKLFEELSIEGEDMAPTVHPKILAWRNVPYSDDQVREALRTLDRVLDPDDPATVIDALQRIVPEYAPSGNGDPAPPEPAPADPGSAATETRRDSGPRAAVG